MEGAQTQWSKGKGMHDLIESKIYPLGPMR